jgi:hypothetical protein
MEHFLKLGRFFFAISMLAFAILACLHSGLAGPALGPPWAPGNPFWTFFTDVALGVAGLSIILKKKARLAAALLALVIFLRVLLLYVPALISNLRDPGNWTPAFELLAMGGASLVLAGILPVESSRFPRWNILVAQSKGFGHLLFASALVVFGIQHFLYARFVSTLVPSWIPWRLFWAYFVGVAFFAAAISIITDRKTRLGTTLLGVMFFLWVLMLHAPRVASAPQNGNEWTSAFVALAMGGGALILGAAASRENHEQTA